MLRPASSPQPNHLTLVCHKKSSMTDPEPRRKPLPAWLKLRIAAATVVKRSPRYGVGNVIALPFGKILKLDAHANEIAAMEFVRANTTIPVPKSESRHQQTR